MLEKYDGFYRTNENDLDFLFVFNDLEICHLDLWQVQRNSF